MGPSQALATGARLLYLPSSAPYEGVARRGQRAQETAWRHSKSLAPRRQSQPRFHTSQLFNPTQPVFSLNWRSSRKALAALCWRVTVVSHKNKHYFTPLQLPLPFTPHHHTSHQGKHGFTIHRPPSTKSHTQRPRWYSLPSPRRKRALPPRPFGFVPAPKSTKKTALQGPHLSTMHDGVATPREGSQR